MKILSILLLSIFTLFASTPAQASSKKSMVGQKMPDLSSLEWIKQAPDIKGKAVILEFWATWCPPCRQSIPHLNEVYKKYKSKNLEIIGISDESKSVITEFTKKIPIDYVVAIDSKGTLNKHFSIEGIPHAVLVNKEGQIIWEGHPMELTESQLKNLLK